MLSLIDTYILTSKEHKHKFVETHDEKHEDQFIV